MPEYGPDINDFSPSWMEDGGGLSGGSESDPNLDYEQSYLISKGTISAASWETEVTSRQNQSPDDIRPGSGGCMADAGDPPDTGTWILGSIDGTCQWIDTTTCS